MEILVWNMEDTRMEWKISRTEWKTIFPTSIPILYGSTTTDHDKLTASNADWLRRAILNIFLLSPEPSCLNPRFVMKSLRWNQCNETVGSWSVCLRSVDLAHSVLGFVHCIYKKNICRCQVVTNNIVAKVFHFNIYAYYLSTNRGRFGCVYCADGVRIAS